jgi:hypothetical protein
MEIGIAYLLWDNPLNCIFFFFLWLLDEDIFCFFNLDFIFKKIWFFY